MLSTRTSLTSRLLLGGTLVVVATIGNLRVDASEPRDAPAQVSRPAPGHGAGVVDDEGAQLIPALFARNPDVRFVYYRHFSKWM